MKDAVLVTEVDALEELVHEGLDGGRLEGAAITMSVHVPLQIAVHVLKDEHEFVLGVDNIVQSYNILVLELLHQRNLSDGGRGCSLFGVEVDFLERYKLSSLSVTALEDGGIGTFTELLELLERAGVSLSIHVEIEIEVEVRVRDGISLRWVEFEKQRMRGYWLIMACHRFRLGARIVDNLQMRKIMRVEGGKEFCTVAIVCCYFLIFWVCFVDDSQTLPLTIERVFGGSALQVGLTCFF